MTLTEAPPDEKCFTSQNATFLFMAVFILEDALIS